MNKSNNNTTADYKNVSNQIYKALMSFIMDF